METVEIIERLGSFGILAALLWYAMTRTLPRTVDVMREALGANTEVMRRGLEQVLAESRTHRQEDAVAHEGLARILERLTESVDMIRKSSETSTERLVASVDRLSQK